MSSQTIVEVTFAELRQPLAMPITVGPLQITERRYTAVTIRSDDGHAGISLAQSREAALAEVGEAALTPLLLGRDAGHIHMRWREMFRGTLATGRVGLMLRAISLVDVALWDLLGQRAGLPVHALLGGYRESAPVTYIAGYPGAEAEVEAVVEAAAAATAAGHRTIKVARTADPELTRAFLRRLDDRLPQGVGIQVDANWIWESVADAMSEIISWPTARILWVEDPTVPENEALLRELRRRSPVPIAAGDELADPAQAVRLLQTGAVDVLRLDVMTIGGISGTLPLISMANRLGTPVSLHISPETSIHLACGVPGVRDVETFDRSGNRFDPAHVLVDGGPEFAAGSCRPPALPGLGFRLATTT
jgi:L-alanine-DL-glutamate epimerase-like enolase superfamily enzyme